MNKISKEEWHALRYRVEIQELSEEEGGGWMAWIPALGKGLFLVEGDTPGETLEAMEAHRRAMYDMLIASGQPIPLPEDVTDAPAASGKWLIRTSPRLHSELKEAAEAAGISLNAYCVEALQKGHGMATAEQMMRELVNRLAEEARAREAREMESPRYAVFADGDGFSWRDQENPYVYEDGRSVAA